MAERSKALRSGRSIFGCVGSNPTPVSSFCLGVSFSSKNIAEIRFSTFWDQQSDADEQMYQQKQKLFGKHFQQAGWPSGLRRCVQVAVSSDAWVRIPLLTAVFDFS